MSLTTSATTETVTDEPVAAIVMKKIEGGVGTTTMTTRTMPAVNANASVSGIDRG